VTFIHFTEIFTQITKLVLIPLMNDVKT